MRIALCCGVNLVRVNRIQGGSVYKVGETSKHLVSFINLIIALTMLISSF